jgi:hypothetical protein
VTTFSAIGSAKNLLFDAQMIRLVRRPRQAADMRGKDAVRASLHTSSDTRLLERTIPQLGRDIQHENVGACGNAGQFVRVHFSAVKRSQKYRRVLLLKDERFCWLVECVRCSTG